MFENMLTQEEILLGIKYQYQFSADMTRSGGY